MSKPKVIVIAGPTASGKTKLAIELAKKINGEIVSCDSMLIYKDMNIGTAKPTKEEQKEIPHYLIDIISPEERFSVSAYKKLAIQAIEEIIKRGKVPIVVGGTGLYIDSLIYGIEFKEMEFDEKYRKKLEEQSLNVLYEEAKKIDAEAMKTISPNDRKRIIRILEIYHQTGKNKTEQNIESRKNEIPYNYKVFALNWEREKLYLRVNERVDKMIEDGLIEEVVKIKEKYKSFPTAMQGLGYKEVVEFLENKITKEEMVEKIKLQTRRYAKRQITWFKKDKEIIWLNGEETIENNINRMIQN